MFLKKIFKFYLAFIISFPSPQFFNNEKPMTSWINKLEFVESFFKENAKRPITRSKNKHEKELGQWISRQLTNRAKHTNIMKKEDIRNIWDTFKIKHIDYFMSNKEIWYEKLEKAISFIEIHGKRPSTTAKNYKEKILGTWIGTQVKNREKCRQIMTNEGIRNKWDDFRNNHIDCFKSNEESWYEKFEKAKSFIEINHKRPSPTAKNYKEKILGSWVRTQVKNREKCKHIMSNEEIRNSWDNFRDGHKNLF